MPPGPPPEPTFAGEAERERESERVEPLETDRDSFTPSTRTAGRGRVIVESSYSFIDQRTGRETHSFPELLVRYGLTERVELRLGWNLELGGGGNAVTGLETSEITDGSAEHRVLYGVKLAATRQERWRPESALILQGFTPTGGEATDTQLLASYVFGWKLPNEWKLDSAVRFVTNSEAEDRFQAWAPSAVLRVPFTERLHTHYEYFGTFSRDREQDFVRHFFSPGVTYLFNPNFEFGVRIGFGLNDQTARFFSNAGVGLRF